MSTQSAALFPEVPPPGAGTVLPAVLQPIAVAVESPARRAIRARVSFWSNAVVVVAALVWFLITLSPTSETVFGMALGSASHSFLTNRLRVTSYAIHLLRSLLRCPEGRPILGVGRDDVLIRSLAAVLLALGLMCAINGTLGLFDHTVTTTSTAQHSTLAG